MGDEEEQEFPLALLLDPSPLPEEQVEWQERWESLQEAISAFPPRVRAVVLLRLEAQLSYGEIERVLGIPVSTAKSTFSTPSGSCLRGASARAKGKRARAPNGQAVARMGDDGESLERPAGAPYFRGPAPFAQRCPRGQRSAVELPLCGNGQQIRPPSSSRPPVQSWTNSMRTGKSSSPISSRS